MGKIDNEIYNSYNWIRKVRYDQSEKAWRKYASKFSIAVMRILRLDKINQKDLVEKANLDEKQLAEILKGKVNLDLKTMIAIQDALGEELMSIKNIDLVRRYQHCKVMITSDLVLDTSSQWNIINSEKEVQQLAYEDYSIKFETLDLKEKKGDNYYEFKYNF